jgi:hypothetical protein
MAGSRLMLVRMHTIQLWIAVNEEPIHGQHHLPRWSHRDRDVHPERPRVALGSSQEAMR